MIVILDIDNTLAINKRRYSRSTLESGEVVWDVLYKHENLMLDEPNFCMIELTNWYYNNNYEIVIFTSRPESTRQSTIEWLNTHKVNYHSLHMRSRDHHYIKDVSLKHMMYTNFIKDKVHCAFDDNQDIIDLWVSLNILCFKVYV
jgi:hypothetical protein